MSRLITFGCSHVYGLGLPDCPTVNHPPSKLGFSNILGRKLGLEVINRADTGSSQKQIAATILQTEFNFDDVVIINWSNPNRRGIWNGLHWEQLAAWNEEKCWTQYFEKYHRTEDDLLDSLMNINLANYYLDKKCKQVINSSHSANYDYFNSNASWNKVNFVITFQPIGNSVYYENLKCGHPDLKSHKVFAKRLLELL